MAGAALTAKVRVEPSGLAFEVEDGESVIQAAWRARLYWPTMCQGKAECRACRTVVIEGADAVVPAGAEEAAQLATLTDAEPTTRLACRLRLTGPVVLHKKGVRQRLT